ncbi:MAG: hypothetical protein RIS48_792 [Pseudomonadota bacterium]|jgi:hypothetical protein|uniref:nuclear transport factor 2 family protein n=1 Tax=Malikia spinosa TaxID=86180 RepID=UPI003232B518
MPPDAISRFARYFEQLQPADIARLGQYYAADARFKDPFNDVRGVPAIAQIFSHMFESLDQPRFVVTHQLQQGSDAFLSWDFTFRFKNFRRDQLQCIQGATHLKLDHAGLVTLHRDYWDAAEELYEKLPLVGGLMRWLKARTQR